MQDLNIKLEELISNDASDFEISKLFKKEIKEYIKSTLDISRESIGRDFFYKHTKMIDNFIIHLYKYMLRKYFGNFQPLSSAIPITIIALGSYGRKELCIYSDIDLMILYKDTKGYNIEEMMKEFITLAWDSGLKLGHRVHEVSEIVDVVKEDITIKTSLLESRMIYGSKLLWFYYENSLNRVRKTSRDQFINEKLEEHKQRLLKNPLSMQPNIKDGYGGMREANMLFWMANIIYGVNSLKDLAGKEFSEDEYKKFRMALEFIFQVRNAIHLVAKKKIDVLNFDLLPDVSSKLGFVDTPRYVKERLCMEKLLDSLHTVHWFTTIMVKKITRFFVSKKSNISYFRDKRVCKNLFVDENKLYSTFHNRAKSLSEFLKEVITLPNDIQKFDRAYIYYASRTILPKKLSLDDKKVVKELMFKERLHPTIKMLYNAGLFSKIFPSMKKITNQPQFDGYHKHPVDIHSIKTLKYIEDIKDEYVKSIYDSLTDEQKSLTKLAALFHDVGKGRKMDHHVSGELIFKKFASTIELNEFQTNICAKVIRIHNKMSMIATREDIYSDRVILYFTGLVSDILTLKILYVVTYADISSVAENIYKSTTAMLLKELYLQSLPAFENEELVKESKRRVNKQNAIKNSKKYKALPLTLQKKIFYINSNQMFLQLKVTEILELTKWASEVDEFEYRVDNKGYLVIKIVRAVPLNLGYLLGKLQSLNILSMNIFKLFDNKKYFEIKFSTKVDESEIFYIEDIIKASFDMSKKIRLRKPIIKKEEITVECNHTQFLAQLKVHTKDQKGLFSYIAKVFDDYGVEIESAKIHTSKGNAIDMFLIEKNGNFCPKMDDILNDLCIE